jgi:hypothetical protein
MMDSSTGWWDFVCSVSRYAGLVLNVESWMKRMCLPSGDQLG